MAKITSLLVEDFSRSFLWYYALLRRLIVENEATPQPQCGDAHQQAGRLDRVTREK